MRNKQVNDAYRVSSPLMGEDEGGGMSSVRQVKDAYREPSFSFGNRVARVFWQVIYRVFFRPSPRFLHAWRSVLLRLFGATVGKNVHVYPKVEIWAPWNLRIGNDVGVANGAILYSQEVIELHDRVVISQGAHLCTGTHDYETGSFQLVAKPIVVGREAWVAAGAFVHPGIRIGEGSVVGAMSVVTKDTPDWMVCSGNPCRPLKPRQVKK